MKPLYTDEDYMCIYDSVENAKGRAILHTDDTEWLEQV